MDHPDAIIVDGMLFIVLAGAAFFLDYNHNRIVMIAARIVAVLLAIHLIDAYVWTPYEKANWEYPLFFYLAPLHDHVLFETALFGVCVWLGKNRNPDPLNIREKLNDSPTIRKEGS